MDFKGYSSNFGRISAWLDKKEKIFRNIEEIPNQRITYNTSLLPLSSLAWQIDPLQHRFILMGNKSVAIADILDKNRPDATLFPDECSVRTGFIRDLSWFPGDNSLSAILTNSGYFNLIDMNRMMSVDSFDLGMVSHCIKFDESGHFPFNVAIGTKSGLRYCDLKSGSQIQHLKTKFDVECIEHSPRNQYNIYTGLSDGNVLMWDLRKTSNPVNQINHPDGFESNVAQIKHSSGSVVVGYKNGDIASFSSNTLNIPSWKVNTASGGQVPGKGVFAITTFGDIICPVRGNILFIDMLYGDISESVKSDVLISPSSISMNPVYNILRMFLSSILIISGRSFASSLEIFTAMSNVKNTEKRHLY